MPIESKDDVQTPPPLCVDLDGTLARTDLLVEAVFALIRRNIFYAFRIPFWLLQGKAFLKEQIARRIDIDVTQLPYQNDFIDYLAARKAAGGRIILTTASHTRYAHAVADHLGLFDQVLATGDGQNLSGHYKLLAIQGALDSTAFDYAANSLVDLPIWEQANAVILVNPEHGVRTAAQKLGSIDREFGEAARGGITDYLKAARAHQALKNLLIFVPLLLSHRLGEPALVWQAVIAFLSFSLCTSSVYLLNDLMDLPTDRRHPVKRNRPLAAGTVSIVHCSVMIPLLLLGSVIVALVLPPGFLAALTLYYLITLAYSVWLKNVALLDVLILAGLHTLRLIAGAEAVTVVPSFWLLAFSMFLFLSLALVKRYADVLKRSKETNTTSTNVYRASDLPMLSQFGSTSAFVAVLVLALYINSDAVTALYRNPQVIWLLCPLMLYLMGRIWLLAHRNEMPEDPIMFAIQDRRSQMLAFAAIGLLWIAI